MKILLIGTVPPELGSKNYGGVARVVWDLAKTLNKKGINVEVGAIGRYYTKYQQRKGINIYGIGFSFSVLIHALIIFLSSKKKYKALSFRHLCKLFYAIYFLLFIKREINFDVIHVHHVINQIPYAAELIGLDVKVISTIHSYTSLIHSNYSKEAKNINLQLKNVNYVTHVSQHLKKIGLEEGIKWTCKDKVVYNGININQYQIDRTVNDWEICFVGSVTKKKGIKKIIEALDYLNEKGQQINVIIAGEGDFKKHIKNGTTDIHRRITLKGQVTHQEALQLMAGSELLVNPSKSESFGLVYLEALSVGTPVIGYKPILSEFKDYLNIGGHNLEKWMIGFDHLNENEKQLAKKIIDGLKIKQSEKFKAEKKTIHNKVNRAFNWDKIAEDYKVVYNEF